jgi:hypothetical protein
VQREQRALHVDRAQRLQHRVERQQQQRVGRIERLQNRVEQLKTQHPEGRRAQRRQDRQLQAEQRLLRREQQTHQREELKLQNLKGAAAAADAARKHARERFAGRFHPEPDSNLRRIRENHWGARYAWRHGLRAAFVPWLGRLFWPYAYSDVFDYTFWPYAYDEGYWDYAYDDFIDTVFWESGSPYYGYAYGPNEYLLAGGQPSARTRETNRTVQQLCEAPDSGVTAWPFAKIAAAVKPNTDQSALFDGMKDAAAKAAQVLKASCVDAMPMTPPGRLRAMISRLSATLEAVRIVRPATEKFYDSLSDEQKARFNAVGPSIGNRGRSPQAQPPEAASACGEPKPNLINLPFESIEATVRPTDAQREALGHLRGATEKAVGILQSACPTTTALTPVGRLGAMESRLDAMLQAGKLVQLALDRFYGSLSNEQKARFNTMNGQASQG